MTEETKTQKTRLIGIELLRFYMAFMVVITHFGGNLLSPLEHVLYVFQGFHVTVFMLISFFLCGKYFLDPSKESVKKRILRIILPLFFWGVVSFLVKLCLNNNLSIKDLILQLITGHSTNLPLWFLSVMLWISCLFWLIRLIFKKQYFIIIISLLSVFCIVAQYTELNFLMFGNLSYEFKYPLGRTIEMIPYASMGIIGSLILPKINKLSLKNRVIILITTSLIIPACMFLNFKFGNFTSNEFGYGGFYKIIMSVLLVLISIIIPLNDIKNQTFNKTVHWVTSFTMGVFCSHMIFGPLIEKLFMYWGFEINTIVICLVIYVVCYIISFLIYLIPLKHIKSLVS